MKRITILLSLTLLPALLFSQVLGDHASTYAVVIGISNYQDPLIPDLKYAHKDAEAFANWLLSPAGGSIPPENILLHTNEKATNAQMILSLDWLIDNSKAGDRAFIYFSGHGDVERVTKFNNGYLLGYDSPPAVYGAGAFAVNYFKDIISSLSENDVQVILISDACRAGKLAGSSVKGAQVTARRLAQQFANEIKILSCQPDEYSLEGEQWGGGRGCFSYHLENALYGFADQNKDTQVNLMELGRYLQDYVSKEVAPDSQIPIVQGPPKEKITSVEEALLVERKEAIEKNIPVFAKVESKGLEEMVLTKVDSNLQQLYSLFLAAIDSNQLMQPVGRSANDYYEQLMLNAPMEELHGIIKRKFVVALLDEGQQIINKFLETDPQIRNELGTNKIDFQLISIQFDRASEILGDQHYYFNRLKANKLYFDFLGEESFDKGKEILMEGLKLDSTLALFYYHLAYYFYGKPISFKYAEKALKYAPNWALAYYLLGLLEENGGNLKQSNKFYKKAVKINPLFLTPYYQMAQNFEILGNVDSATHWRAIQIDKFYEKLEKNPSQVYYFDYNAAGRTLLDSKNYELAKELLLKANDLTKNNYSSILNNLKSVYVNLMEFENAIGVCQIQIDKGELKEYNYAMKGRIYFNFLDDNEKAKESFAQVGHGGNYRSQRCKLEYLFQQKNYKELVRFGNSFLDHGYETPENLFLIAEAYHFSDSTLKASEYYQRLEDNFSLDLIRRNSYVPFYYYLAVLNHRRGNLDEYASILEKAKTMLKGDPWLHFNLARIYVTTEQSNMALQELNHAIKLGWQPNNLIWLEGTLCDPILNPIRETEEFKTLVKKHFPEYYDIATKVPGKNIRNKE